MTGAAGARRPAAELGVILDWDGVVVDSGDLHERAWTRLAEELGQPLPAGFFASTFGLRNQQAIPLFTSWARADEVERIAALAHRKESLFRELVRVEGLRPIPGVRALLAALAAAGVPLAVGTSAPRENLDVGLAALELDARFDATVTAEDVRRGKPDPEVFLRCAAAIAREPGHC